VEVEDLTIQIESVTKHKVDCSWTVLFVITNPKY